MRWVWERLQVQRLQQLLFKHWPAEEYPELAELALANCGTLQKRECLEEAVAPLPLDKLQLLVCRQLRYGWAPLCRYRSVCARARLPESKRAVLPRRACDQPSMCCSLCAASECTGHTTA